MWTEEKPNVVHLQEFGVPVWVYLELHLDKMCSRVQNYVFTSFTTKAGAIHYYDASTRNINISTDLYFQCSDPELAQDHNGLVCLPLKGGRCQGKVEALMGMEAWAWVWWEEMKMLKLLYISLIFAVLDVMDLAVFSCCTCRSFPAYVSAPKSGCVQC